MLLQMFLTGERWQASGEAFDSLMSLSWWVFSRKGLWKDPLLLCCHMAPIGEQKLEKKIRPRSEGPMGSRHNHFFSLSFSKSTISGFIWELEQPNALISTISHSTQHPQHTFYCDGLWLICVSLMPPAGEVQEHSVNIRLGLRGTLRRHYVGIQHFF